MEYINDARLSAGSLDVGLGQFAYVANAGSPPVILPENPGIDFMLPASLGSSAGDAGASSVNDSCMCR